jgi:hypothetical protein
MHLPGGDAVLSRAAERHLGVHAPLSKRNIGERDKVAATGFAHSMKLSS